MTAPLIASDRGSAAPFVGLPPDCSPVPRP